jgi:hypothetical protein
MYSPPRRINAGYPRDQLKSSSANLAGAAPAHELAGLSGIYMSEL